MYIAYSDLDVDLIEQDFPDLEPSDLYPVTIRTFAARYLDDFSGDVIPVVEVLYDLAVAIAREEVVDFKKSVAHAETSTGMKTSWRDVELFEDEYLEITELVGDRLDPYHQHAENLVYAALELDRNWIYWAVMVASLEVE